MSSLESVRTVATRGLTPQSGYSHSGGGIIKVINQIYTTPTTQAYTRDVFTEISAFAASITLATGSLTPTGVLIYARLSGEFVSTNNMIWGLSRNNSEITNHPDPGSRTHGVCAGGDSYAAGAANNTNTPAMVDFWWWDPTPGFGGSVYTYRIGFRSQTNGTMYINRTVSDADNNQAERLTSELILMEVYR